MKRIKVFALVLILYCALSCFTYMKMVDSNKFPLYRLSRQIYQHDFPIQGNTTWRKQPTEMNCHPKKIQMSKEKRPVTALLSFPGSGNTWTRHLIEYTSGIATGSVYCDPTLKPVFIGECQVRDVIVIKSHERKNDWVKFEKAIVLIRSPYRSIISFFNYNNARNRHKGFAPKAVFDRKFGDFSMTYIHDWLTYNLKWLQFKGPTFVVIYEELLQNTVSELKKLNNFLNVTVSDNTYACLLKNIEGGYRRSYKSLNGTFNPMQYYTRHINTTVENAITKVEKMIAHITGNNHNIERYTTVFK